MVGVRLSRIRRTSATIPVTYISKDAPRSHPRAFQLDAPFEVMVVDTRNEGAIGARRTPTIHPIEPRKITGGGALGGLGQAANPEPRSPGSSRVLTVSFFALASWRKSAKNTATVF